MSISPYERIYDRARQEMSDREFARLVGWHLQHGFVFARPDFFVMGRPVMRFAPMELLLSPEYTFRSADCDCWYIHSMSGNMSAAWSVMPWPLPWIAYERMRDGKRHLTFRRTEDLRRLCPPDIYNESFHELTMAQA